MDGLIIVNKEKGYTSRDVVNIISKELGTKKIGHTGTLDPIATGVLVVGYGQATKIFELLFQDEKEYIAEVKLGILTDTYDITGKVLEKKDDFVINKNNLIEALNAFKGKYLQEVPIYSAVKVNGKKLYEYARNGEKVELPKKEVEIKSIELLSFDKDVFSFKCTVSKGTYIRSLIKDIGTYLKVPCTMTELNRVRQGVFKIENSYTLDEIKNNNYEIISLKDALSKYKQIEVDDELRFKIINGQKLSLPYDDDILVFIYNNKVLGIYKKENKVYKVYKVVNQKR